MASPTGPIFVFTDMLSVHASLDAAARYHEFRDTLIAFDQDGQVFEIPPFFRAAPIRRPENRRAELVRKLRRELISLAVARPDLMKMSKWEVKRAPDDEIVRLAVRWFLDPDPPPREHWWQFWRPRRA
jgi:hypothetical protein